MRTKVQPLHKVNPFRLDPQEKMNFLHKSFLNVAKLSPSISSIIPPNRNDDFDSNGVILPRSASSPNKKQNQICNFLSVYFDFSYFLCCSPFRVVLGEDGCFKLRTSVIQKFLFLLMNGSFLCFWFTELRLMFPDVAASQNPLKYFKLLERLFSFIFQVLTIKRFWFNQEEFLKIFNFIQLQGGTLPTGQIKIQRKLFSRLICFIFAVMALYEVIWRIILAPSHTWHQTIWNRQLAAYGRYTFFLAENVADNITLAELSWIDYVLALFIGLAYIQRYIVGYFTDLALLFTALTIWSTTFLFSDSIQKDLEINIQLMSPDTNRIASSLPVQNRTTSKRLSWSEIYRTYLSIRDLCHLVNKACGGMITMYLASALLYYSMGMDSFLIVTDIRKKIRLLFFICNSTFAFIISADASNRMNAMKSWLSKDENRREVPLDQLNSVLNDLHGDMSVGIRGSNIFTVTYSLLWHMMTTIITYFIICLQTRQQEQLEHKLAVTELNPENRTYVL